MIELKDPSQKRQKNQKSKEGDFMNRVSNIYIYIRERRKGASSVSSFSKTLERGSEMD